MTCLPPPVSWSVLAATFSPAAWLCLLMALPARALPLTLLPLLAALPCSAGSAAIRSPGTGIGWDGGAGALRIGGFNAIADLQQLAWHLMEILSCCIC